MLSADASRIIIVHPLTLARVVTFAIAPVSWGRKIVVLEPVLTARIKPVPRLVTLTPVIVVPVIAHQMLREPNLVLVLVTLTPYMFPMVVAGVRLVGQMLRRRGLVPPPAVKRQVRCQMAAAGRSVARRRRPAVLRGRARRRITAAIRGRRADCLPAVTVVRGL